MTLMSERRPSRSERYWAMAAHLTALVTVIAGLVSGGVGAVVALFVPLGMALYWRERSPYAAFHALQATVFQAGGAILYILTAVASALALVLGWLVTAAVSVALLGLVFLPVAAGLTVLVLLVLAAAPVAGLLWVLRGADQAYHGQAFEYPLAGRLAARALAFEAVPRLR